MSVAPIIFFAYNRPLHVKQALEALMENELSDKSDLFIFSDGPKEDASTEQVERIKKVREVIKAKKWCKDVNIIESDRNKGLANSVIAGVTDIVNRFGKAIVVEDDVITSKYFLRYMNEGLDFYQSEERVLSLGSWNYFSHKVPETDTFFMRNPDSIAWATWKRAWDYFERDSVKLMDELKAHNLIDYFDLNGNYGYSQMLQDQIDGKVSSWAIRWTAVVALKNGLALYPSRSLTKHIGFGADATHCTDSFDYNKELELSKTPIEIEPIEIRENEAMLKQLIDFENELKNRRDSIAQLSKVDNRIIRKFNNLIRHLTKNKE